MHKYSFTLGVISGRILCSIRKILLSYRYCSQYPLVYYGMQILIFKDVRNTEFYIFQDMAFIPISIAITTVVVGELLDINNKRDSRQKTRMLTSTFFSDIGFEL